MAYFGKTFKEEKAEKYDEFVKSLGLPAEKSEYLLKFAPDQRVEKTSDGYNLVLISPKGEKVIPFKSGVEFEDTLRDQKFKGTITVDGNTVTHTMKFEIGIQVTIKKEFTDSTLKETISHAEWNGSAFKYYKAV